MKKLNCFLTVIIFTILIQNTNAQIPEYELVAKNFSFNCGVYTEIEWDIYLQNTNSVPLEYISGQYIFTIDPAISQGGTLTFRRIESDLPLELRPALGSVSGSQLRLGSNIPVQPGNGFIISTSFPGTRIARVRLTTSSTSFIVNNSMYPPNQMNIKWKNVSSPVTQISAAVNNITTNITDTSKAFVQPNFYGMFIFQTIPWEGCLARLLNLNVAVEALYNVSSNSLSRKDTVTVELHDAAPPYNLLSSFRSRLDSVNLSTFSVLTYPWFPPNPSHFYFVIKHHNSIETWSKITGNFSRAGYVNSYSFTDSDTSAYGNNLKLLGSEYCIYSGDVNQDKVIDLTDVILIYNDSKLFTTGYVNTDLNGDYIVNITDLFIAYDNSVDFISVISPM